MRKATRPRPRWREGGWRGEPRTGSLSHQRTGVPFTGLGYLARQLCSLLFDSVKKSLNESINKTVWSASNWVPRNAWRRGRWGWVVTGEGVSPGEERTAFVEGKEDLDGDSSVTEGLGRPARPGHSTAP